MALFLFERSAYPNWNRSGRDNAIPLHKRIQCVCSWLRNVVAGANLVNAGSHACTGPSDDVEIFQTSSECSVSVFSKIGNAEHMAACYFVGVPKVPLPVRWGSPTRDQVASSFYFLHDAYPQKTPSVPYVPCLRRIGFFCSPICAAAAAAAAASCMAGDQNQKRPNAKATRQRQSTVKE